MSRFDLIALEIADKSDLSDDKVVWAVNALRKLCIASPSANKHLMIGGFDDDPRELSEIPEVRDFVCRFFAGLMESYSGKIIDLRLDKESLLTLAVCCFGTVRHAENDEVQHDLTWDQWPFAMTWNIARGVNELHKALVAVGALPA